jgi:hypothetical protein
MLVIPKNSSSQGDLLKFEWSLSSSGGPLVEKPETNRGSVDLIKAEPEVRSRGELHNSVRELSVFR